MSFKSLMIIKAFTGLFFGIGLLFMPGKLFLVFGAELNTAGMFPAREYASALTGIFFLCWFARNVTASDARGAIILALLVYDLIGFIVTVLTVAAGVINATGWFIVFIYLFFTVGFGYLMVKPDQLKIQGSLFK